MTPDGNITQKEHALPSFSHEFLEQHGHDFFQR
jgi:hypothetical protein